MTAAQAPPGKGMPVDAQTPPDGQTPVDTQALLDAVVGIDDDAMLKACIEDCYELLDRLPHDPHDLETQCLVDVLCFLRDLEDRAESLRAELLQRLHPESRRVEGRHAWMSAYVAPTAVVVDALGLAKALAARDLHQCLWINRDYLAGQLRKDADLARGLDGLVTLTVVRRLQRGGRMP